MLVKKGFPIVPTLIDDFFKDLSAVAQTNSVPAVNIKEDENQFTVEVAAPGFDKKDFKINLENNVLTIASEKEAENNGAKDTYTRKEYSYKSFKRSFTLPEKTVDSEKIAATYVNGELVISLPKLEEVKPTTKLIEIQ